MHFQLAFEQFEQREGVSSTPGETSDDFVVVKAAHFFHVAFHHGVTQSGLAITTDNYLAVTAYAYNCCHEQTLV
ncbi:hypothetical protein GCM10022405_45630 [Gibbsiella dentisursi]|uniref:Uncharacterized protein n=1 Tax=Gibbsiella dentisursi TaxID=796890 RepID=A0ABP7M5Z0_9GAMM